MPDYSKIPMKPLGIERSKTGGLVMEKPSDPLAVLQVVMKSEEARANREREDRKLQMEQERYSQEFQQKLAEQRYREEERVQKQQDLQQKRQQTEQDRQWRLQDRMRTQQTWQREDEARGPALESAQAKEKEKALQSKLKLFVQLRGALGDEGARLAMGDAAQDIPAIPEAAPPPVPPPLPQPSFLEPPEKFAQFERLAPLLQAADSYEQQAVQAYQAGDAKAGQKAYDKHVKAMQDYGKQGGRLEDQQERTSRTLQGIEEAKAAAMRREQAAAQAKSEAMAAKEQANTRAIALKVETIAGDHLGSKAYGMLREEKSKEYGHDSEELKVWEAEYAETFRDALLARLDPKTAERTVLMREILKGLQEVQ